MLPVALEIAHKATHIVPGKRPAHLNFHPHTAAPIMNPRANASIIAPSITTVVISKIIKVFPRRRESPKRNRPLQCSLALRRLCLINASARPAQARQGKCSLVCSPSSYAHRYPMFVPLSRTKWRTNRRCFPVLTSNPWR